VATDPDDIDRETELYDRLVNRLFGASLSLSALASGSVDSSVTRPVQHAIEQLDAAIAELRQASLARVVTPEPPSFAIPGDARRLCRFSIAEIFAYAPQGHAEYFLATDHMLWARETQGLLVAAASGTALARREGRVFYDAQSDAPLYYEDGGEHRAPTART